MQEDKRKQAAEKDIDCSSATRGVWLVKVPKYLSAKWNSSPSTEVGRLRITRKQSGSKPNVTFNVAETLLRRDSEGDVPIPKDYQFDMNNMNTQTLAIYSQTPEKITHEGKVVHRAECRPLSGDANYLNMKKISILSASQPARLVKQLDKAVNTYKPVSDHKNNIEYEKTKKEHGKKMRDDKDKVMELLFGAFEKHQFYNLKDLVKITNQPVTYLKEILKEICSYNLKNPHKNMWELKPEYRHYHAEGEGSQD
jgi:transcription initiation factor TFIIF subunit beta